MKKIGILGLGAALAFSLVSTVMAEGADKVEGAVKPPKGERMNVFKKADANADGKLSLDEFKTIAKNDADKKFTAADTDKDGFLTPEEMKDAKKKGAHDKVKGKRAEKDAATPEAEAPAK